MSNETLSLKGFLKAVAVKNGRVVGYYEADNQITNTGRDLAAGEVAGSFIGSMVWIMKAGTASTPAPAITDTDLVASRTIRSPVFGATQGGGVLQYTWSFASSEMTLSSNSVIGEVGFYYGSTNANTLFSRVVFSPINKTSDMVVNFTYQVRLSRTT